MFVPFVTVSRKSNTLLRRKGGGGGRSGGGGSRGGGGGSRGGGRSGGSSEGGSTGSYGGGSSTPVAIGGSTGGYDTATSYGGGGGPKIVIPAGQPFAGRPAGGGTRAEVYGTRTYGSGYPGAPAQRGVSGAGFPFYFWPVVWGGGIATDAAYLHDHEYGDASNTSRPGGPLQHAPFRSATLNTTFHVLADNATVTALISAIATNCSASLTSTANATMPLAFNSTDPGATRPEQAVQYYRASSVVLTLDGYNDTNALTGKDGATDVSLPSGIDVVLLECLNATIGAAVPLVDEASSGPAVFSASEKQQSCAGALSLVWLVWCILLTLL